MDSTGSILGSGTAGFTLGSSAQTRLQATLQDDPIHDVLLLKVTFSDFPKWSGAVNGSWDAATQNWRLASSGSATTYFQGDNVLFDYTAMGTTSKICFCGRSQHRHLQ